MTMTTNARDEKWSSWIEWSGGDCPLPDGTIHRVRFNGEESTEHSNPNDWLWGHSGRNSDIIAYRYKIKEPETTSMHEDLYWLAWNVSEWNPTTGKHRVICRFDEKPKFAMGEPGDHYLGRPCFDYNQWQAARQQLGLESSGIADPDEEECIQLAYERMNEESVKVSIDELSSQIGGPRKAENFLMQAAELLAERGKQYDQPGGERSMGKTMGAFNIITGRDLTEAEGWLIMTLLKRVRQYSGQGYHKDSAEDGVTYGALEAEALESADK